MENNVQDIYIFHYITSRLVGKASHLISQRDDVTTWAELKVFTQHSGDPRSADCIAIELETYR